MKENANLFDFKELFLVSQAICVLHYGYYIVHNLLQGWKKKVCTAGIFEVQKLMLTITELLYFSDSQTKNIILRHSPLKKQNTNLKIMNYSKDEMTNGVLKFQFYNCSQ